MLVLDAGAFVAVERGDRDVVALVKRERLSGRTPVTNGGVVGQVWRGGRGKQVPLARLLAGVEVAPIDDLLGRRAAPERCWRAAAARTRSTRRLSAWPRTGTTSSPQIPTTSAT